MYAVALLFSINRCLPSGANRTPLGPPVAPSSCHSPSLFPDESPKKMEPLPKATTSLLPSGEKLTELTGPSSRQPPDLIAFVLRFVLAQFLQESRLSGRNIPDSQRTVRVARDQLFAVWCQRE